MSTDRFQIEPDEPKRERSLLSSCLIGCLVITAVLVVLLLIAAWWIRNNWRDIVSDFGTAAIEEIVEQSGLPVEEQGQVREQLSRVTDAFRSGELPPEKLGEIVEELLGSPVMTSMLVSAIETNYIENSGLSQEEKDEGRVTLRRFVRGMIDRKIDEAAFDEVISHVADRGPGGDWEVRETATDEELRAMLAVAKQKADAAEIPPEPEEVDPSDQIKRILDKALGVSGDAAEPAAADGAIELDPSAESDRPSEPEQPAELEESTGAESPTDEQPAAAAAGAEG